MKKFNIKSILNTKFKHQWAKSIGSNLIISNRKHQHQHQHQSLSNHGQHRNLSFLIETVTVISGAISIPVIYSYFMYRVAMPHQYLARTGLLVDGIQINNKMLLLPFQELIRINMEPITYQCTIDEIMSFEKIPFKMPLMFTIGPCDYETDDGKSLRKYTRLLSNCSPADLKEKVLGVICGEARLVAANMSIEKLFSDKKEFKQLITKNIGLELECFGLKIYNATIEELSDTPGNEYFSCKKEKSLATALEKCMYLLMQLDSSCINKTYIFSRLLRIAAQNFFLFRGRNDRRNIAFARKCIYFVRSVNSSAKIDVAEQIKIGEIERTKHVTESRIKVSEMNRQAIVAENERTREIEESKMLLEIARTTFEKNKSIAQVESIAASEKRRLDLQKEVEESNKLQILENLRAKNLTQTKVAAEMLEEKARGESSALLIKTQAENQATILKSETELVSNKNLAEAQYYTQEKIAQSNYITKLNEANGLSKLIESFGDAKSLNEYLLVDRNMISEIIEKRALAIKGLEPKINIWNTGSSSSSDSAISNIITDFAEKIIPLSDSINHQYGVDLLKSFKDSK